MQRARTGGSSFGEFPSIEGMVSEALAIFASGGVRVDPDAPQVLVNQGLEHSDYIYEHLRNGEATTGQIIDALVNQLTQAENIAVEGRREIVSAQDVRASMRLRCWFYPWC